MRKGVRRTVITNEEALWKFVEISRREVRVNATSFALSHTWYRTYEAYDMIRC